MVIGTQHLSTKETEMTVTVECGCMKDIYQLDPHKEKLEICKANVDYLKEHKFISDEVYREAIIQIKLYEIEKETDNAKEENR